MQAFLSAYCLPVLSGLCVGYLFGSFPTGYFAGRLYGVDVRRHGSGRTGGTNVLRTAGWPPFALTVFGDVMKGVLPVLLMRAVLPPGGAAPAAAVIGALLGHNWSFIIALLAGPDPEAPAPQNLVDQVRRLFARAKGGAGVATTAGAALTLFWPPVVLLAILGIALLVIVRYASVSSITVATLYPFEMAFFVWTGAVPPSYLLMSVCAAAIVLYVHIPNMKRLRAGTEQKFGQRLGRTRSA